jgi:hypothetical protein
LLDQFQEMGRLAFARGAADQGRGSRAAGTAMLGGCG